MCAVRRVGDQAVSISYAVDLLDVMEARGIPARAVIGSCGLTEEIFDHMGACVTLRQFEAMVAAAGDAGAALGYEFGMHVNPSAYGSLGFAVVNAPNLRAMATLVVQFFAPGDSLVGLRLHDVVDTAFLQVEMSALPDGFRTFLLDAIAMFFSRRVMSLGADVARGAEIWMDRPEPAHYRGWCHLLLPVRFSMPDNRLVIPAGALDSLLPGTNRRRARAALGRLDSRTALMRSTAGMAARVKAILETGQASGLGLDDAARIFGMSASTLKRRLQMDGVSFRGLLDEVRYGRAQGLLINPGLPVTEIAAMLGYSDMSNFCRAFRKWSGVSPVAWRQQQLARAVAAWPGAWCGE